MPAAGCWARPRTNIDPGSGRSLQQQLPLPTFNATNVANLPGLRGQVGAPTTFVTAPVAGGLLSGNTVPPAGTGNASQAGGNLTAGNAAGAGGVQGECGLCTVTGAVWLR